MNDRLEKELAKMTPEGRRMWEKVAEEEEQAMMELLEGWDKAGVKKSAGEKKNTGE
jgi:DNA-binding MarR family transcriptional regulator